MTLKRIRWVVSVVAMAGMLLGGALVQPASAAAAATCYGGSVGWTHNGGSDTKDLGPYTTSSRCRDINLRTDGNFIWACVIFVNHTTQCNYHTAVGPPWTTIATDVRDGTRFKVRLFPWDTAGSDLNARSGRLAY